jgi:hypothetical protein
MIKVRKLDRRYNGNAWWTHRAENGPWYGHEARAKGLVDLYEQRVMLTTAFGPGCFVEEAGALVRVGREVPKWGFDHEGNVFLRDEALVTFELAKGRWNG